MDDLTDEEIEALEKELQAKIYLEKARLREKAKPMMEDQTGVDGSRCSISSDKGSSSSRRRRGS